MGGFWPDCLAPAKSFHVKIILLDKQELIQEIQGKTTGQHLLDNIFKYLNLVETAYFGLRYQDNSNQTHWLDPNKRVSQQIKGVSPITLYLGVKFYAADPCKLIEEITRYQFFLQVKLDILQGRLPVQTDLGVELAALALQSELGDFDKDRHSPGYVSEFRFLSNQTEELEKRMEATHARLQGLQPSQAENRYLEKVKWLDMYGVDLHPVIGEDNIEYFLGLTPSGIIVLRNRNKVGNYFWPRISKIYFKGKYFMLRVRDKNNDESTYGFETPSRDACKHLWKCCVEHHAFFRLVQVSPAFSTSGVVALGSRLRQSDRESSQEPGRRSQPTFTRVPSQRFTRRSHSEEVERKSSSNLERRSSSHTERKTQPANGTVQENSNSMFVGGGRSNSLPRSNSYLHQSLPPGLDGVDRSLLESGEISLQSLQFLQSKGLYGSRSRRSSEHNSSHQQSDITALYKKRGSRRGGSDDESEVSGASLASNVARGQRRSTGHESGSESESSRSARKNHRSRRRRHGSYRLVETDQAVQEGRGGVAQATVRKSGYVNSGAETESEVLPTLRRNKRRQRSRSRSPSEARAKLPTELTKHFEPGLVEPDSPSMLKEIQYTHVETDKPIKVRYSHAGGSVASTGRRSRHNSSGSASRRRLHAEDTSVVSMVQNPTYIPPGVASNAHRPISDRVGSRVSLVSEVTARDHHAPSQSTSYSGQRRHDQPAQQQFAAGQGHPQQQQHHHHQATNSLNTLHYHQTPAGSHSHNASANHSFVVDPNNSLMGYSIGTEQAPSNRPPQPGPDEANSFHSHRNAHFHPHHQQNDQASYGHTDQPPSQVSFSYHSMPAARESARPAPPPPPNLPPHITGSASRSPVVWSHQPHLANSQLAGHTSLPSTPTARGQQDRSSSGSPAVGHQQHTSLHHSHQQQHQVNAYQNGMAGGLPASQLTGGQPVSYQPVYNGSPMTGTNMNSPSRASRQRYQSRTPTRQVTSARPEPGAREDTLNGSFVSQQEQYLRNWPPVASGQHLPGNSLQPGMNNNQGSISNHPAGLASPLANVNSAQAGVSNHPGGGGNHLASASPSHHQMNGHHHHQQHQHGAKSLDSHHFQQGVHHHPHGIKSDRVGGPFSLSPSGDEMSTEL